MGGCSGGVEALRAVSTHGSPGVFNLCWSNISGPLVSVMKSPYTITKITGPQHVVTLAGLQALCFPDDHKVPVTEGWWWLVTDPTGSPVGFAAMTLREGEKGHLGYFRRGGVLEAHRGHGLQRRLIAVREKLARALGFEALISTTFDNPHSGNNLIREGFKMYEPEDAWGLSGTVYWRKDLA